MRNKWNWWKIALSSIAFVFLLASATFALNGGFTDGLDGNGKPRGNEVKHIYIEPAASVSPVAKISEKKANDFMAMPQLNGEHELCCGQGIVAEDILRWDKYALDLHHLHAMSEAEIELALSAMQRTDLSDLTEYCGGLLGNA